MNQQPNRLNRIAIVAGVLILVFVAAWFTVIQQKLNQVSQSESQLADLQSKYASLKSVADQKPLYLALIKQVQSRLTGVELTADPRAYIPSYLEQIEDLAKRDGLVVTSVVPQAAPTPSGSPSPAPSATGASAVENIPGLGSPIKNASHALNSTNTQVSQVNQANQAASGGPAPTAAPLAGASPQPAPSGGAAPTVQAGATNSPRTNAIVYLNQSFTNVPINMELSGTYTDLQRFLRDLNKFPKLIGVGNVTMTSARGAVGETPKLHIILPIVAYRLSPSAPAPAATAPPSGANGGT